MTTKETIRTEISALRKAMGEEEVHDCSQKIIRRLECDTVFLSARHILVYSAIQNEVNLASLVERWKGKKQFYLPVVVGDGEMEIRPYTSETSMELGKFGILEPAGNAISHNKIDLIICPGVAFDAEKNRLGRGGGYYDRYLSHTLNSVIYAVAYDFQVLAPSLPTHTHDKKMHRIFTPNRII